MSHSGIEALAGLQLLVAVAKAGGGPTPRGRAVIAEALEDAHLPDGITAVALIRSSYDVDVQIAQVASQRARDVAFHACSALAHAGPVCPPKQQAILDRIERAWAAPSGAAAATAAERLARTRA
jgi:hypothetical protein